MGYLHINNLYKSTDVLKTGSEVYALEKIHGTSAHVRFNFKENQIHYFSGGGNATIFKTLFDKVHLIETLSKYCEKNNIQNLTIFGEYYGGKQQGMRATYGDKDRFVAFDVKIDDKWLTVPEANSLVTECQLEFVFWTRIPSTVEAVDAERDRPSTQAVRNGMGHDKISEGIVIRPLEECCNQFGERMIAKHKRPEFSERQKEPKVIDEAKLEVEKNAIAFAEDWVIPMRLQHVFQRFPNETLSEKDTKRVIDAMLEDVKRESQGEVEWSKEFDRSVGKKTAQIFKQSLNQLTKE